MGLPAFLALDAWHRHGTGRQHDRRTAQAQLCRRIGRVAAGLIAVTIAATTAQADSLRIATWAAPFSREGPGLLLRDILKGEDPQILAGVAIVARVAPDILVLTDFDFDLAGAAAEAFARSLAGSGQDYPHHFAIAPNSGRPTGLDLDGNGRLGEARDAMGYGRFAGDGGLLVLSKLPLDPSGVIDLSQLLWRDLPGATLPEQAGQPFPSQEAQARLRLSTVAQWAIPVLPPDAPAFTIYAFAAGPPVFDGPEDMNGLRNRDELRLPILWMDGQFGARPSRFVLLGNANLDPADGAGLKQAIGQLLADPRLQDPAPQSGGGTAAADPDHAGDPALDTADWPDNAPGNLRVSYVLPSADWTVTGSGVFWPPADDPDAALLGGDGQAAGPHRLVWVDISR
jgi:hypothetical protein